MKKEDNTITICNSRNSKPTNNNNKSMIEKGKSTSLLLFKNKTMRVKELHNVSNLNQISSRFENYNNIKCYRIKKFSMKKNRRIYFNKFIK